MDRQAFQVWSLAYTVRDQIVRAMNDRSWDVKKLAEEADYPEELVRRICDGCPEAKLEEVATLYFVLGARIAEIQRTLDRYGATHLCFFHPPGGAIIAFQAHDRRVKFTISLPNVDDDEFKWTKHRKKYLRERVSPEKQRANWEPACRQRWRALALVVKAKLEAVEAEISTFEEEFLAHIMLPDGRTVGEWSAPQLAAVYENGEMPPLLGGGL